MRNINTNKIHPLAKIGENVILGDYNIIGENVVIEGFKGEDGKIIIGDCNVIHENTKLLAGEGGIIIGDWNVFHNNMLVMGGNSMSIGHNCWFGQNTVLDSSGGLKIGNGVRVGMYSQIWTHVASGELIEGCQLFGENPTTIEDDVWLVGSCTVSSGINLGEKGIFLTGSNITKSTEPNLVYAGSPAKLMQKLNFYKPVTLNEKFEMMLNWVEKFTKENPDFYFTSSTTTIRIFSKDNPYEIIISKEEIIDMGPNISFFSLSSKKFTKRLSPIERAFYKSIFGYKARFLPVL